MKTTTYYEKYPSTIWKALLLIVIVTFIKTAIEIGVGLLGGVYISVYASVTGEAFDAVYTQAANIITLVAVSISGTALISYLLYFTKKRRHFKIDFKESLALRPSYEFSVMAILGVFAITMVGGLVTQSITSFFQSETPAHIESIMNIEHLISVDSLITFIGVVIVAPFFEEFLFRKILLDGLLGRYKPLVAMAITALFFALFHMNLTQGAYTFFLGFYLAYLYYVSGSYWLVVVVHAVNNLYALLARQLPEEVLGVIAIMLFAAGCVCIYLLLRKNKEGVAWTPLPAALDLQESESSQDNPYENSVKTSTEASTNTSIKTSIKTVEGPKDVTSGTRD